MDMAAPSMLDNRATLKQPRIRTTLNHMTTYAPLFHAKWPSTLISVILISSSSSLSEPASSRVLFCLPTSVNLSCTQARRVGWTQIQCRRRTERAREGWYRPGVGFGVKVQEGQVELVVGKEVFT